MLEEKFGQLLLKKLQIGDTGNLHLNASSGKRSGQRIELSELNAVMPNFSKEFLIELFNETNLKVDIGLQTANLSLIPDTKDIQTLQNKWENIYYEEESNIQEQGVETFGFGYPIILWKSKGGDKKNIAAPLCIWQLTLTKDSRNANKYLIERDEDYDISANKILKNYLESEEGINLPLIKEEFLEDGHLRRDELVSYLDEIINLLNHNGTPYTSAEDILDLNLAPSISDEMDKFLQSNERYKIIPAGTFGIYKKQKEAIINDFQELLAKWQEFHQEAEVPLATSSHKYSGLPLDPTQQKILNHLTDTTKFIVQGPPGTGKSQVLTGLITNALSNGNKVLVVCEKKTAMEVIFERLKELGLDEYAILIEDVTRDRKQAVDRARAKAEKKQEIPFNIQEFYRHLGQVQAYKIEITSSYKKTIEYLQEGLDRKTLAGLFLEHQAKSKISAVEEFLNSFSYEFTEGEADNLSDMLLKGEQLHAETDISDEILGKLHPEIFYRDNIALVWEEIRGGIKQFQIALETISKEKEQFLANYYQEVSDLLKEHTFSFQDIITDIEGIMSRNERFKDSFFIESGFTHLLISIRAKLSSTYKKLLSDRTTVYERFEQLNTLKPYGLPFHRYPSVLDNPVTLYTVKSHIEVCKTSVRDFSEQLKNYLNEHTQGLSEEVLFHASRLQSSFKELNLKIENTLNTLNKAKIFAEQFIIRSQTIQDKNKELIAIKQQIDLVLTKKEDFEGYFSWRYFYNLLDTKQRITLDALMQARITDWKSHFLGWYYNQLLIKSDSISLLKNFNQQRDYLQKLYLLRKMIVQHIGQLWTGKKNEEVTKYNRISGSNINLLFQQRNSEKNKKKPLRKIVHEAFDVFTAMFPVVMVNPTVCSSLFPLKKKLFDFVIFDEASQLRLEDTYPSLLRGKVKIISGDSQQMPPSSYFQKEISLDIEEENDDQNGSYEELDEKQRIQEVSLALAESESLLSFCENAGYQPHYLDVHYRSKHPYLIEFSNAAFYKNRLSPIPAQNDYQAFYYHFVEGSFINRYNSKEAEEVIRILSEQIKANDNGEMPSVGVATFNVEQRNYILRKIDEKCLKDSAFNKKIGYLRQAGLFVKNLENIQGDERDVMILCTTYGLDKNGKFNERFGAINIKAKGHKLLNVIITRAKEKMFVVTSIPNIKIKSYSNILKEEGINGKACFYAYLAYAQSCAIDDESTRKEIINELIACQQDTIGNGQSTNINSPKNLIFEEQVRERMKKHLGTDRISVGKYLAGFSVPLLILSKYTQKPILSVEVDGKPSYNANESLEWEEFREQLFKRIGIDYYRTWVMNWWANPDKEVDKLLARIQELDKIEDREVEIHQKKIL